MPRGKKKAGCQTNSNNNIMGIIKERCQATVNLDTPMKLPIYSPSQQNHALVSKVVTQPLLHLTSFGVGTVGEPCYISCYDGIGVLQLRQQVSHTFRQQSKDSSWRLDEHDI